MEYIGILLAVTMAVPIVSSAGISSVGETLTREKGINVTFPCTVEGKDYNIFFNPIIWYKMVGNKKIQMNNNAMITGAFKDTGRYFFKAQMKPDPENNVVEIPLTITDVRFEDNGTFRCELTEGSPSVIEHSLIIPAQIEKLDLSTNESTISENGTKIVYTFTELESSYVSCEATGGNPAPHVRIYRDKLDLTGEFTTTETTLREGTEGLQTITHKVKVTDPSFRATFKQNGEKLKCVARIPRMSEMKKTVIGKMDVKYKPKFVCEGSHFIKLPIEIEDYIVSCVVQANPKVTADDIYWTIPIGDDDDIYNLTSGSVYDVFSANVTATEEGHLNATLTISGINTTHFNTYHLRAKNNINEEHLEIYLGKATTTTPAPPTTQPPKVNKPGEVYEVYEGEGANGGAPPTLSSSTALTVLVISLTRLILVR